MKKPSPIAVAIVYHPDYPAPKILLKAKGAMADRVLQLAEEHQVTSWKNDQLAQHLFLLPEQTFIPEDYFEIMANILSAVYTIEEAEGDHHDEK